MKYAVFLVMLALCGCQARPGEQPFSDGLSAACHAQPDAGRCRAAFIRYYHDGQSGSCRPFTWGGCGGHVPFETREACETTCGVTTPVTDDRLLR